VLFLLEWLPQYRVDFFQLLREALEARSIRLDVGYGRPLGETASLGDSRSLPWGQDVPTRRIAVGRRHLVSQQWRSVSAGADLVVVNEGARLTANYMLLGRQLARGKRVAFWGHGANLDAYGRSPGTEHLKKVLYRLPHWWFAYTDGSSARIRSTGFPAGRVTVVNNSTASRRLREEVRDAGQTKNPWNDELGGKRVGLFLGSLRETRRLPFLLEAADSVAKAVPDFALVVAGDGPERGKVEAMARGRSHVHVVGRVDGARRASLLEAAEMMLLPGHIGLNLLDGFVAGLPTVTTRVPQHAPEVEYLVDGVNGAMLPSCSSPSSYAAEVVALLRDLETLQRLSAKALEAGGLYTEEGMVSRFAAGIEAALDAPLALRCS
jgi:L-malate glycosyltransferase